MRLYLTVDTLTTFIDKSGQSATCQRITPILDKNQDITGYYSQAVKDRVQWMKECCGPFCVYACQLCNGWTVYNVFVFEFNSDEDALMFKLRWMT